MMPRPTTLSLALTSALTLALSIVLGPPASAFELPRSTTQCVVAVAPDWDSSRATLTTYEKRDGRWHRVHGPWPVRTGKNGLAWGRGLHPLPGEARHKREGDGRAPAGVFSIGGAWGYAGDIQRHSKLPYRQITPRDLWVEDSASPHYNAHLVLDHEPATTWEKKQQMRQGDPAHSLKLFIAHNAPPKPVPGAGSAIFFHIWRDGGGRATHGCTAMSEPRLKQLIAWINPGASPVSILLPEADYHRLRAPWKLP